MKWMSKETVFIVIVFFMMQRFCFSQNAPLCVDPNSINPGAVCDNYFQPVCGCDNKTYKNDCYANASGIYGSPTGPCEPIAIDVNPNPMVQTIVLTAVVKYIQNITIFIQSFGNA